MSHAPVATISAPTRIADLGGWTDTWFARHGVVCHLAVWPGVNVHVTPYDGPRGMQVRLHNFDREWHWTPGTPPQVCPDPLIGACLDEAALPSGAWLLEVTSDVPPGASMGTSASVCVAVLAALDALRAHVDAAAGEPSSSRHQPSDIHATMPHGADDHADSGDARPAGAWLRDTEAAALVRRAHRVETIRLRQQSGIQDQWAAACGGVNLIEMAAYPEATCTPLALPEGTHAALDRQLLVVLLSEGHDSSAVHTDVVRALEHAGADDVRLEALRACARDGAAALRADDLVAYGAALARNTEMQAALHPSLVGDEARRVVDVVRGGDALGWKVNGAGGAGGSVTVLATNAGARTRLATRVADACPGATVLDVRLATTGVRCVIG